MADGTPTAGSYVRPYICAHGSPRIVTVEQGSTISTALFSVGDAVERGTTTNAHRVVLSATGVTADLTTIFGFAAEAAEASATIGTKKVTVWPCDGETQFVGFAKGTIGSSCLLTAYNLRRDSTLQIPYIDVAVKASGIMAVIDDVAEGSTWGDTNGYVVFHMVDAARTFLRTSS